MYNVKNIYPPGITEDLSVFFAGFIRSLFMKSCFNFKVKRALGIAGFSSNYASPECWTVKLHNAKGVYGTAISEVNETADDISCRLLVKYFPDTDEDILDTFSVAEIMATTEPSFKDAVRNFPSVEALRSLFDIADICIRFPKYDETFSISFTAKTFDRTIIREGLSLNNENGICNLVQPMGADRNVPALRLAIPLFKSFAGAAAYTTETLAGVIIKSTTPAHETISSRDAAAENRNAADCRQTTYSLEYNNGKTQHNKTFPLAQQSWWTHSAEEKTAVMDNRPRLLIISGFLGCGKTTFIKKLIEYETEKNRFVGIIQNEAGETGLDGFLLDYDCSLVQIDEGCVCCSLSGQLKKAVAELSAEKIPDTIILETSGVANPMNLLSEIDELTEIICFDSVTTIVDSVCVESQISESGLAIEQIKAADIIVLNKTDLIKPKELDRIFDVIKPLNLDALFVKAVDGWTDFSLLFGETRQSELSIKQKSTNHINHMHEHITTRKITFSDPVSMLSLQKLIKTEATAAFRIKGVVDIDSAGNSIIVQGVGNRIEFQHPDRPPIKERFLVIIEKKQ